MDVSDIIETVSNAVTAVLGGNYRELRKISQYLKMACSNVHLSFSVLHLRRPAPAPLPIITIEQALLPTAATTADFSTPGKYLAHYQKSKYIDVLIKCHQKPRKLLRERELALRLGHSKYILQPLDSGFIATKSQAEGLTQPYHVMIFEKAEGDFTSLQNLIHDSGCLKSVKAGSMRSAVKGIFRGLQFMHNSGYLYGDGLTEDAIRYTLSDNNEILIKMTNLGDARRFKKDNNVFEYKKEVQKVAKLVLKLIPFLDGFHTSGTCNMLRQLTTAMLQADLQHVPCMELVNTSLFMLNGTKRVQYVCSASDTLKTDKVFVNYALGELNLNFSANWKNQIPDWAKSYINRNYPVTDAKFQKLKEDTHTVLTIDFKQNMDSISVNLHKDVSLQSERVRNFLASFRLKFIVAKESFELSPRYTVGLPECCRYMRNLANHPNQICQNASHSTKAFNQTLLVNNVMEKVADLGTELGTLIFALNHDRLLGAQNLIGDLNTIAKQGGGCLYSAKARVFRETQTTARLDAFRREVLRKIEEVRATNAGNELLDGCWPEIKSYPNIMKHLHEVVIHDPDYVEDWTSSSSGEYESADEDEATGVQARSTAAPNNDVPMRDAQDSMVIAPVRHGTIGYQQDE